MDLSASHGGYPVAVYSPHPMMPSRDRVMLDVPMGVHESLAQYLERNGIAAAIRNRPVAVSIDGQRVPRAMWRHIYPKPGTLILIQARMGKGGGGGKNPVAMVLSIALIVMAPYAAASLGASMGVTSAMGLAAMRVGVMMVGGMLINSLFPPSMPAQSYAGAGNYGSAAESPTYSLSGGSNSGRPYEPMPVMMGVHRVFPDFGAKPYTEFSGDDQFLYQVFDFGYNTVTLADYKIGTTPLSDYSDVELEESEADGALTLFPANVDVIDGANLTYAVGYITRTSSIGTTGLAVEITGSQYYVNNGGGIDNVDRTIEIEYQAAGASTWLPFWAETVAVVISSGRRAPIRKTYKINVPLGQYNVRVRRTSADDTDSRLTSDILWSALRSYQPDTGSYVGRKRVALKIKASGQISGTVQQLSAMVSASTQTWDGTSWAIRPTSNPAWWLLAAARGRYVGARRVWGGGILDSRINLDNIKAFGAWCDARALTFNAVFEQQMSVFDMLAGIALRGRGTVSRSSGMVEVVWDAPDQAAVAVFGMSNIKLDSFEIDYVTGQLADEIVLSFINPELDWQTDTVRALAPGVTDPVRSMAMSLFGCTNKIEAGHDANLYIATNLFRTKRYRWQMDWEGMPVSRGEVGYLSHDLASFDYSGRLVEGTTASVLKLERSVPLYPTGSFITLVKPDGTFASHAVAAGIGNSSTLTLASALAFNPATDAAHPVFDYRWLYGSTATPGKKIKIESIAARGYDTVEITAIDETSDYYDSENNPYIHVPVVSSFGASPEITNVALSVDGVRSGLGYLAKVTVTWDAGAGYSFADVRVSIGGEPAVLRGQEIRSRSFEILMSDRSSLTVEVCGYGSMGRVGSMTKASVSQFVDFASMTQPSDVGDLQLLGNSFVWPMIRDLDVIGYRIKFQYGTLAAWDTASFLHAGLLGSAPAVFPELPAARMMYGVKAVDAAQKESQTAAWVSVDARIFSPTGDPLIANVVEEYDLAAGGFAGTITGGTVSGHTLAAQSGTSFYSVEDATPMYGADSASFYKSDSFSALTYQSGDLVVAGALVGSRMTLEISADGQPIFVDYRKDGADWATWAGAIIAENGTYNLRVRIGDGAIGGVISALVLTVDAPDINETLSNVALSAVGTRLPIRRSYQSIKAVSLQQIHDGGSAVRLEVLDRSVSGPLCMGLDSSGAGAAAHTDVIIQGY